MSARPPAAFHAPSRSTYVKDRITHFHATAKIPMPIALFVGVSYQTSTSNHNRWMKFEPFLLVSLIKLLHQTTTPLAVAPSRRRCLLSNFYIKPQQSIFANYTNYRCLLSNFYIKPQLPVVRAILLAEVSLIKLLHQTTTASSQSHTPCRGVSYQTSTSNHNP